MESQAWLTLITACAAGIIIFSLIARFASVRLTSALASRGVSTVGLKGSPGVMLPAQIAAAGAAILWLNRYADLSRFAAFSETAQTVGKLTLIAGLTGVGLRVVHLSFQAYDQRLAPRSTDDLRQRRLRTRLQFLERVVDLFLIVVAVGTALMSFEDFRRFGGSVLASAGLASVIVGFAAQRSLGNLIAGVQIAFTQPIRLGDVVIVENEWGTIEEINLTYVVVRIWDLRRLILPITYFVEKPFQNWTRTNASLLGTVFVQTGFATSIEDVRDELCRIVENSPLWDRKICVLQVTDANETSMTLRALVSATDSPRSFDLRCEVRERLIVYLQKRDRENFPKSRVEII